MTAKVEEILSFLLTAERKCVAYKLYPGETPQWDFTPEDEVEAFQGWMLHILRQRIDIRTYLEDFKVIVMTLGFHAGRDMTWEDVDLDCSNSKWKLSISKENNMKMFKSGEDLCDELYVLGSFLIAKEPKPPFCDFAQKFLPKKRPRDEDE